MKKFLLMVSLLSLAGCSIVGCVHRQREDDFMSDVSIVEIDRCSTEWDQIQFPVNLNEDVLEEIKPIETNKAAITVGTKIIEKLHKKAKYAEYVLIGIVHFTENNIWQFEYSLDQRNVGVEDLIDCGGLYVVIDGNEGTLIKSWVTE